MRGTMQDLIGVVALVAVLAVPACGRTIEGRAVAGDTSVRNEWRSPVGTWVGSYVCAQGKTGLTLTVEDQVLAEFEFYPLVGGAPAAAGRFRMFWQVESGRITFRQNSWIDRPGSYVMVDLVADLSADAMTMSGRVIGTGCTTFTVSRNPG